ncbi:MAG: hypothetical protein ABH864_06685, partial [archaeon]
PPDTKFESEFKYTNDTEYELIDDIIFVVQETSSSSSTIPGTNFIAGTECSESGEQTRNCVDQNSCQEDDLQTRECNLDDSGGIDWLFISLIILGVMIIAGAIILIIVVKKRRENQNPYEPRSPIQLLQRPPSGSYNQSHYGYGRR